MANFRCTGGSRGDESRGTKIFSIGAFLTLTGPWPKSDVWGLFWIHTSTGTISCSTDCRRCHFGRKKFFQDFCQKTSKFCSSIFTRLFSQWWITTLPNTPLPKQYTIYSISYTTLSSFSNSESIITRHTVRVNGTHHYDALLSWVKVDGHSTKSGRSLGINRSVEVGGPKELNWTVRKFQTGRSEIVKMDGPKVLKRTVQKYFKP